MHLAHSSYHFVVADDHDDQLELGFAFAAGDDDHFDSVFAADDGDQFDSTFS